MEKPSDTAMLDPEKATTISINEASISKNTPQHDVPALTKVKKIFLAATMACISFLDIFAVQATVLVWPAISDDLNIPSSRQQWIASAYNLAFGCSMLLWGRLADLLGHRKVFITGAASITVVTTLVPFAPNEVAFDILRALQGLGAAATVPSAVGILSTSFKSGKEKNYAFVAFSGGMAVGSVLGNIAGGIIGTKLGWRWIFWIITCLAACLTTAAFIFIPRTVAEIPGKRHFDFTGAFMVTGGLVMLLYALSEGNIVGWGSPWIMVLLVISACFMGLFYFWECHLERNTDKSPLMRISMLKDLQFAAAFLAVACFFASYSSYFVFVTLFYEDYQGMSVFQTTLRFIPSGVAGCVMCFATAKLLAKVSGFHLLLIGSILATISPLLFAIPIPPYTTYWAYGFPAMCLCLSVDVFVPTINLFIVDHLPDGDQALGGGLINTSNQLGRAVGLAIATAVQTAVGRIEAAQTQDYGNESVLRGLRAAEWVLVGLGVTTCIIVISFFRGMAHVGTREH